VAQQINKSALHPMQFDTHIWNILYFTDNNPGLCFIGTTGRAGTEQKAVEVEV
jgi:hypothetical protein